MKKEYIICSAIWVDNGEAYPHQPKNIHQGIVIYGRRHHNCIAVGSSLGLLIKGKHTIQGFLTNIDNFVNRELGAKIAFEAGQTDKELDCLFSEDLY